MGAILVSKNPETGRRVEIAYEIFYLTTEVLPKSNWKTLRLVSREPNEFAFGLPFSDNYEVRTIVYDMTRTSRGPPPWMKSNFAYLSSFRNANAEQPKENSPKPSKNRQNDDAQLPTPTEQLNVLAEGLKKLPANDSSKYRSPLARRWSCGRPIFPNLPSWNHILSVTLHTIFEAIIASEASITEFTVDTLEEHSNRQLTSISNPFDSFTLHEPLLIGVESLFAKLKTLKLRFQTQQKHRQRIGAKASFLPFITLLRRAEQIETLILEFGEPEVGRVGYVEDCGFRVGDRLDVETLFGDATFPRLLVEDFLKRHSKTLRWLVLAVRYLPSGSYAEETVSTASSYDSAMDRLDEQTQYAEFMSEFGGDLVDGLELVSHADPSWKIWESRKNLGGGINLLDLGDKGYGDDGWTFDTIEDV
ncbi:hypothetical protein V8E51_012624 [Hyaloscypha variabilis]